MENNNVPPPASSLPLPEGVQGRMPLPVGEPMVLNNPTGDERAALEQVGWSDGDPVPSNFAEITEVAKAMASEDNLLPPIDPRTPPLVTPEETDIADLPAAEQEKYYEILRSALTHAKEASEQPQPTEAAPPGVNEAIQAATASPMVIADDTAEETYATGEAKTSSEPREPATDPLCPQCGWDARDGNPLDVSDSDKTNFLQALLGQTQFYKEYELFGGNINITVRTLKPLEVDACFKQVMLDAQASRIFTQADEREALLRYRSSLQIVAITGPGIDVSFPKNLEEWTITEEAQKELTKDGDNKIRGVWDLFQKQLDSSETMHRLIVGTVARFNTAVTQLEVNSNNPDFWKAIGSGS